MQNGTENRQGRMRTVKRLLLIMAVVISVAVVGFTLYMILASDNLASYVSEVYDATYATQAAVRDVEISFLRTWTQAENYLDDPAETTAQRLLRRAEDLEQLPQTLEAAHVGEPERTRLVELSTRIAASLRRMVSAGSASVATAQAMFHGQVEPLFEDVSRILDGVVRLEDVRLAHYLRNAAAVNGRINASSVGFAVLVVAVVIAVCIGASAAIRKTSADVYWRDAMFRLISDNVDEVFEVYDTRSDELLFVSSNLDRVFGVPAGEYLRQHDRLRRHLIPEEEPLLSKLYFDADAAGGPRHAEFHYDNPRTGVRQTFHSVLYPIQDERGRPAHHVMLTRDVTEDSRLRGEIEAALEDAEAANRSKQEFLSRMSHEIRTPINAIIGMEALAASALHDPERVSYYLQQIDVSARHLLSLVNDILDMSKIESGRLELAAAPLNLDGLFSDLVMMVGTRTEQKKQTLTVMTPNCRHRRVIGDELRLRQVLLNLLTNANKYTQPGGKITLRATQRERADGFVDMSFSVQDNGIGIPAEDRERMFRAFERGEQASSQPGTGLGLSISRHLVEEMGGSLRVSDNEGGGSVFSFTVPLQIDPDAPPHAPLSFPGAAPPPQPDRPAPSAPPGTAPEPAGRRRILVAEDNFINMEIARELLESAGYEVVEAENGREAVDRLQAEPPGSFAAVIMDIQMPVMDGYEAAALMRADPQRSDTPILAMTANVFSEADQKWLFDDFIDKPINPKRMLAQVEAAHATGRNDLPGDSNGQSDQTIPE